MATHRTVTQTSSNTITQPTLCDLCRQGEAHWYYRSRTPTQRHHADQHTVTDWWTETLWHVCRSCGVLVDDKDTMALAQRLVNMGNHQHIKPTYKLVVAFLENLNVNSKQRMT